MHSIPTFIENYIISTQRGYVKQRINTFLWDSDQMNPHTSLFITSLWLKGIFFFVVCDLLNGLTKTLGNSSSNFISRALKCSVGGNGQASATQENNVGWKSHFPTLKYMKALHGSFKPKFNYLLKKWRFVGFCAKVLQLSEGYCLWLTYLSLPVTAVVWANVVYSIVLLFCL